MFSFEVFFVTFVLLISLAVIMKDAIGLEDD
jgi:hypothetical protein